MKEKALAFYRQGYNCSQCLLKAAEAVYQIPVSRQCLHACRGVCTGFGTGGLCSLFIAGIMIFGLLFDEATVKRMRLQLLSQGFDRYQSTDCAALKAARDTGAHCEMLVAEVAGLIEEIIAKER